MGFRLCSDPLWHTLGMKTLKLNQLSEQAIKLLIKDCERKIKGCEADLDDYETYVQCQRQLLERKLSKPLNTSTFAIAL
jgi:hypothetical protein